MNFKLIVASQLVLVVFGFISCSTPQPQKKVETISPLPDTTWAKDTINTDTVSKFKIQLNDSLDELAAIIAATCNDSQRYPQITKNVSYQKYFKEFSKRWTHFDSTRVKTLMNFEKSVLGASLPGHKTLYYPFSGPDYLYAGKFFPKANHYILVGLEPIGSLDALTKTNPDSLGTYFNAIHTSLNAILKFSFFRTNSMEEDLRQKNLDGVVHLLLLFLKREGNAIVSCRPFELDSLGGKIFFSSFSEQKASNSKTKGLEICFVNSEDSMKVLDYLNVNLSDYALKRNPNFMQFMKLDSSSVTYLKGASYLLHKPHFSRIRQFILSLSRAVVQDDSGIAIKYFLSSDRSWKFNLYGNYTEPIRMFKKLYQPALDSLYLQLGSLPLGFGIGYNFKDNNSNLMIAIAEQ